MNASINAVAKRYRYTGKERDEETGLYYHGARYYIPWLCRWMACDPLEAKYAGMSAYNYGFNNPIKWQDADGMQPEEDKSHSADLYVPAGINPDNSDEINVLRTLLESMKTECQFLILVT